ncbi:MAG: shikimate dehydrogenase [Pseudomonadota bacterium]
MSDRYAVVGNPIAHSRSPLIHAEFARQTGQNLVYEAILAPLDRFRQVVEAFRAGGGRGMSVTVPFKQEAWHLSNELSARALAAEAVNTLSFEAGVIVGDNTDGVGLTRDIAQNLHIELTGKRILLMGAGGAARGVILPLLELRPAALFIANRTPHKALELIGQFREYDAARVLGGGAYAELAGQQFDTVINATSASLGGELPALPPHLFAHGALAYDMMYGSETPFMAFAREQGAARVADGLGMLVEQAAEAFFIWRGVRPDTVPVLARLRALIAAS